MKTKAGSPQHSARAPLAVQIPDPVMNWNPFAVKMEPVVVTVLVRVFVDVLVKVLVNVFVDVSVVLVPDS
ncbi:MAG: hypothetical protein OK442_03980 [Thaumarchaeota archaeon]|nr:hypothetical protein [Nitrososphaerota archaeon]